MKGTDLKCKPSTFLAADHDQFTASRRLQLDSCWFMAMHLAIASMGVQTSQTAWCYSSLGQASQLATWPQHLASYV